MKKDYFCISMLMRSLPLNQLLCQHAVTTAVQSCHVSIHIRSFIKVERGLVGESERNKMLLCQRNPVYNDVHVPAALKRALVPASCYTAMQLCHVSIHIPSQIRIERGLAEEPRPRT